MSKRVKSEAKREPVLLPVLTKADDHPCHRCSKCCEYVAVEIDEPETLQDYDHIVWYLHHENLSVCVDWERDWFIRFSARCNKLTSAGMCGVYENRPRICQDFDWRECENRLTPEDDPVDKWVFEDADEFLRWFERVRPNTHRHYLRFKRRQKRARKDPALARVGVGKTPARVPA